MERPKVERAKQASPAFDVMRDGQCWAHPAVGQDGDEAALMSRSVAALVRAANLLAYFADLLKVEKPGG
eukprot:1105125-Alexandrium_andersonii.AAC.1